MRSAPGAALQAPPGEHDTRGKGSDDPGVSCDPLDVCVCVCVCAVLGFEGVGASLAGRPLQRPGALRQLAAERAAHQALTGMEQASPERSCRCCSSRILQCNYLRQCETAASFPVMPRILKHPRLGPPEARGLQAFTITGGRPRYTSFFKYLLGGFLDNPCICSLQCHPCCFNRLHSQAL